MTLSKDGINQQNRLGKDTEVKGEITAVGDFRIDGKVIGTVKTQGRVVLGKGGFLEGKLLCNHADLEGEVRGHIEVNETLSLRDGAFFEGKVKTKKLIIESGAVFNVSSCVMSEKSSSLSPKKEIKVEAFLESGEKEK